jgi:sulfur dioxygenase
MQIYPVQLFDATSSTYTYILSVPGSKEAVIIDPVDTHWERDLMQIERLGLTLVMILETHAHADHVTSAGKLREMTQAQAAVPSGCGIMFADRQLEDGDVIHFAANEEIRVIHTPGHTAGSVSYLWRGNLFSGDALLINGCGRTDFQGGSATALYHSITQKLFSLPDSTLVWPAHDYKGFSVSSIAWEKRHNARIANKSEEAFVETMAHLNLPKPKMMDVAVPANQLLGLQHAA